MVARQTMRMYGQVFGLFKAFVYIDSTVKFDFYMLQKGIFKSQYSEFLVANIKMSATKQ
mgnify:CR=1 FL=1